MPKLHEPSLKKGDYSWLMWIKPSNAQIVAPVLLSASRSRSSLPIKVSPTSPSVVLHAVRPEKTSAAVHRVASVVMAIKEEKCIPLSVPLVAKIPRYLLSQEKGGLCIAANVIPKLRLRPTLQKHKKRE